MKLSVVIPARDEEGSIAGTVTSLREVLEREQIAHELIVVDDGSTDATARVVTNLAAEAPAIRLVVNPGPHGFGWTVRRGLDTFTGDAVAIFMADASDDPQDLVRYFRKIEEGYECVFGSRFIRGSQIRDYPAHKLLLNRLANSFVRLLFWIPFNDVTNAFKCYRREVIEGTRPLLSHHFNLTVELPLKAIVRGYSYAVIPISWTNRASGMSKLKIKEMDSRYLFIVLYLWLEKMLSRGDYHRRRTEVKGSDLEHDQVESG
ncbi:MAG: glycosyltransferase family 2 protein [Acidobacteria bacterium]|nr:glycosyltransferase family 2 protein [Acidobacteriota bacterium]